MFIREILVLMNIIVMCTISNSSRIPESYHDIEFQTVSKRMFGRGPSPRRKFYFTKSMAEVTLVNFHQSIELTCAAKGSPPPTIHWLYNDTRIPQGITNEVLDDEAVYEELSIHNSRKQMGVTKTTLFLDCVKPQDVGKYSCVADTPRERIVKDTLLKLVQTRGDSYESCLVKKALHGIPARIFMWTDLRIGEEHKTVQLFCRADGWPKPRITWYENDEIIDPLNIKYELLPSGDLLIKNLEHGLSLRRYKCRAENSLDQDEKSIGIYALRASIRRKPLSVRRSF